MRTSTSMQAAFMATMVYAASTGGAPQYKGGNRKFARHTARLAEEKRKSAVRKYAREHPNGTT